MDTRTSGQEHQNNCYNYIPYFQKVSKGWAYYIETWKIFKKTQIHFWRWKNTTSEMKNTVDEITRWLNITEQKISIFEDLSTERIQYETQRGKKCWIKEPQNISEPMDNLMQFAEKGQRRTRKLQTCITQEHRCKTS